MLNIFDFLRNLLFYQDGDNLITKPIVKIILTIILILTIIVLIIFAAKKEKEEQNREKIKKVVFISILAGISIALYFLKINLPFFLFFLDVQISNVPALIGGFLFGPLSGAIVILVRTIIKLPMTSTAGVGELADLVIGVVTVIVSSLIYHKSKTKKNAIKALIYSSISWVLVALIVNWLFIADFYVFTMFDGNEGVIVGAVNQVMGSEVANKSNYMLYYLLVGILPFNLCLSTLVSVITFFVYKRISVIFNSLIKNN